MAMSDDRLIEFDLLLKEFVGNFCPSEILCESDGELVRLETTPLSALNAVYSKLPGKFPPLYQRLVLTYRWHRSEVGDFDILEILLDRCSMGCCPNSCEI